MRADQDAQPEIAAADAPEAAPGTGTLVRDGRFEFIVQKIERGVATVGDQFTSQSPEGENVVVTLNVSNNGDEQQSFDTSSQQLLDASGRRYGVDTFATVANDPNVGFTQINNGNSGGGHVGLRRARRHRTRGDRIARFDVLGRRHRRSRLTTVDGLVYVEPIIRLVRGRTIGVLRTDSSMSLVAALLDRSGSMASDADTPAAGSIPSSTQNAVMTAQRLCRWLSSTTSTRSSTKTHRSRRSVRCAVPERNDGLVRRGGPVRH